MKNTFYLLSFTVVLAIAACKSSSKIINTYELTPTQTEIAKKRWPQSDAAKLSHGKSIYTNQCTQCHKTFVIESFSEKKWNHEIDDMSPKANLTPEEKQDLTYFILSYREMKAPVK
ncbi:MAG: hypothetical protein HYX39_07580 [Bacteroidetes bacterium]|nr:hypothetical protein [Bacteroidota bacterium]